MSGTYRWKHGAPRVVFIIGGSSGIAVFSGFLVYTIFQPLAAKGFACKSY